LIWWYVDYINLSRNKNAKNYAFTSAKGKKRYLVYECIAPSTQPVKHQDIIARVTTTLSLLPAAKAGIQLIYTQGNKGIVRVNNEMLSRCRLGFAYRLPRQKNSILRTLYTTGILAKAKQMITPMDNF